MAMMNIDQDRTRFTREISYLDTLVSELQTPINEYDKIITDIQNQVKLLQYDVQARKDVLESLTGIDTASALQLKQRIKVEIEDIAASIQSNQSNLEVKLKEKEIVVNMNQPVIKAIKVKIQALKDAVGFNEWI